MQYLPKAENIFNSGSRLRMMMKTKLNRIKKEDIMVVNTRSRSCTKERTSSSNFELPMLNPVLEPEPDEAEDSIFILDSYTPILNTVY